MFDTTRTPNALIDEQSPYLLQHAYNPVAWLPWGPAAFEKARSEDKPILVSVGYSTCHWCHVMERESFENEGIAQILNEYFVPIKVDREERPDVDATYMNYLQLRTGSGGWPMNAFLTPQLTPFFAGTYFPPEDRGGRAGFPTVLMQIAKLWQTRREALQEEGSVIVQAMRDHLEGQEGVGNGPLPGNVVFETFYKQSTNNFDEEQGGFGGAPKFPRPVVLDLMARLALLRGKQDAETAQAYQQMTAGTLMAMSAGGIRDHLGGGFHRYSVDRRWHVPHFEKMLYDQAQIATALLRVWSLARWEEFREAAIGTLEYVHRDLRHPEGGFYSAEDADSFTDESHTEHGEGAFYVWTLAEVQALLPPEDVRVFREAYAVGPDGNVEHDSDPMEEFTGKNVLYRAKTGLEVAESLGLEVDEATLEAGLARSRETLFNAREKRPRPHLDDKIITAWNGLMISAFAQASSLLLHPDYAETAAAAARFIEEKLMDAEGSLLRSFRKSAAAITGFAADYAFYIQGLLDLYEATFETRWLALAERLQERMNAVYLDTQRGGYFSFPPQAADSIMPLKEEHDSAEPAPNSVAALNLLRLAHLLDRGEWQVEAERIFAVRRESLERSPFSCPALAGALAFHLAPPNQVVIAGSLEDPVVHAMTAAVRSRFQAACVLVRLSTEEEIAFFSARSRAYAAMKPIDGKATAYVCREFACERPVQTVGEMVGIL
jgi:uncharacterized protein YyaL (SSP411 family)